MSAAALSALESSLRGRLRVGEDASPYAKDDSPCAAVAPLAALEAEGAPDVRAALSWAQAYRVPVTPRSGGTGRVGGAVPRVGGLVLSTAKMNQIDELDALNLRAVVGPGVVLGALQEACESQGMFYPPDPNSRSHCMIGGNVATNAAGPRAYRYGATRAYVTGMEVVLMGGECLTVGSRVRKSVSGYDLSSLLVGSEGTLGVVTRVFLKLLPAPQHRATMCVYARSDAAALDASRVAATWPEMPECIEFIDERSLACMRAGGVAVPSDARALILLDVLGEATLEDLGQRLSEVPGVTAIEAGITRKDRERIWAARSDLSYATRRLALGKYSDDVVVPQHALPALLDRVARISELRSVQPLTYGHAGDGNMHVNFLWDDEAQRQRAELAVGDLMRATVELGGSISGEHGIGLTKSAYLGLEHSDASLALQMRLKSVFDPHGLMNPGKVFTAPTHSAC